MILFLIGAAAGIVSGMGIGGGTVLIPALVIFLNPRQQEAQGVNLLFFIPAAIIALIIHAKNKAIDFKLALPIIISGLIGAYLGSTLAIDMPGNILKKLFGVFLLAIGLWEMLRKGRDKKV